MSENSSDQPSTKIKKSHKKLTSIIILAVFFMFGFSYLMVPIFTFVCKQAGINGKNVLSQATANPHLQMDQARSIKIEFTASIHHHLDFVFKPTQHYVELHPGERKTVYFYAENKTGHAITVQAVPSITPADGARFFKKIECFCFTQQPFKKNEKVKMFVNFYVDPAVPNTVKEMTLAYTLFDVSQYAAKNQGLIKGRE